MGEENVPSVETKRLQSLEVFKDATFNLHKWHSNNSTLENHDLARPSKEDLTYNKLQLGLPETK